MPHQTDRLSHLERLEAESIQIMREVAAEADKPVMLYSIGKDSAVMLDLAMRAFAPAKPPVPLLHVDPTCKFRDMYELHDRLVAELGGEVLSTSTTRASGRASTPSTTAPRSTPT